MGQNVKFCCWRLPSHNTPYAIVPNNKSTRKKLTVVWKIKNISTDMTELPITLKIPREITGGRYETLNLIKAHQRDGVP